jgi:hypothetical protein
MRGSKSVQNGSQIAINMISRLWKILLGVYIFLLPWQTRWIYGPRYVNGSFWEYGSSSWYATEIVLWLAIILFSFDRSRCLNLQHLFGKIHYRSHKINLYIAAGFVAFLAFSILHSLSPALSYDYVFRILEGICLLILLVGSGHQKPWLYSFWSSAIVQSLFAVYQFFSQNISANKWLGLAAHVPGEPGSFVVEFGDERWLRAYGSFGSPNILGGFLAIAFITGLVMYLSSRPAQKIYLTLGQSLILIGLILSFSRGAWIAAVAGWVAVGVYVILKSRNKELNFFTRYHLLGVYIKQFVFYAIVVGFLMSLLAPLFATRMSAGNRLEKMSVSERVSQYSEARGMINNNLLFGVGPGAYTFKLISNDPKKPAYSYQPVHNVFMLVMAEWGVLGSVVWLLIFGLLFRHIIKTRPEYLPVLITMLVAASFDHFLVSLPVGMALWWLIFSLFLA